MYVHYVIQNEYVTNIALRVRMRILLDDHIDRMTTATPRENGDFEEMVLHCLRTGMPLSINAPATYAV